MTGRAELLLVLGLPPQASANEIELVYLERRAKAEKCFQQGDKSARFEVERLDGAFRRLRDTDAEAEEAGTTPLAVAKARERSFLRPTGSAREANGSLACGIAACLVILLVFYVYWPELTGRASIYVLSLPQSPVYFLVFLLALAAEILAHATLRDEARARLLIKKGLEPTESLDEKQISRARTGRNLGRIAVALAVLLAILLTSSFFHFLKS